MTVENGETISEEESMSDVSFLKENIDIKYLKKTIDMGLVDSLLEEFGLTPEASTLPTTQVAEEPSPEQPGPEPTVPGAAQMEIGQVLAPKEEKSIVSRIKNLWRGTDRKIEATENKISNLLSLHEKAKEVRALKQEYEESVSKKLGK
jgi:hypothetical protein